MRALVPELWDLDADAGSGGWGEGMRGAAWALPLLAALHKPHYTPDPHKAAGPFV